MTNWEAIFGSPENVAETFGSYIRDDGKCSCLMYRFYPLRCLKCKHYKGDASEEEQIAITLEWLQEEAS